MHKKLSFPLRISSVNVTKSARFDRFRDNLVEVIWRPGLDNFIEKNNYRTRSG